MVMQMGARGGDFPGEIIQKWQSIVDLVVRLSGARASLIMRVVEEDLEVFVSSRGEGNPYQVGERDTMLHSGLYCETVIREQEALLVRDALQSERWRNNPDLKHGMVSYLGFPIRSPGGRPFGTICLLDDKANPYSAEMLDLMEKLRDLIESQLSLVEENRVQRLFAAQSLLRRMLDNIPTAVCCMTPAPDYRMIYINEQFTQLFGYTLADIPTVDDWMARVIPDELYRSITVQTWKATVEQAQQRQGMSEAREFHLTCKDGRAVDVLIDASALEDMLLVSLVDITVRKHYERELKQAHSALAAANRALQEANRGLSRLAKTDSLTGVWNRRRMEEFMEAEAEQARRYGQPVSLLMFDIDKFKAINDQYGHLAGDRVLVEVGKRFRGMLRKADQLARWGGDEFVVAAPHCKAAEALALAEKLRAVMEAQPIPEIGAVTISFGVAELRADETLEEWLERADVALYEAKLAGSNSVRLAR